LDVADVGDYRRVAEDTDVRGADGRVVRATDPAEIEVEFVKREPFHHDATGLRFDGGQRRVAEFLVSGPIPAGDAVQETLGELEEFIGG
jgi:hypothetical protein